ncbi:MAG: secretin and TonB N-terminal domain-containing protein, partial [Candidatus Gastranaerophilales bacterium]|nr:secretin and TonB N-terminal domain-containing protein [Candidatus Gastranaerophilales bacterium]
CVSILAYNLAIAAPLVYDLGQPAVRTDYSSPNKINLSGNVNFNDNGQLITLSLRNTDVQQVLRMFADKAGLNIVFHSSATGTVTLDLVDVKLEDAFKMVMKMTDLTYVIKDKTILVVSTKNAEKLNLTKDNIMVIPVKYSDAAYLAQFLNTNVFGLNTPGLSYGPIVSTNAEKNELLVFGTDNDYQLAKKIVDRFDRKPLMTTYRVNHTTPFEMAKMICQTLFQLPFEGSVPGSSNGAYVSKLNASLKSQSSAEKAAEGTIGGGTVACVLTSGVTTGNITSYQSKPTMTLYVQQELGTLTMMGGSEQQVQMVNDFILENDRKQPQAYLEIAIISLSEEGSKEFNNNWLYAGKHLTLSFDGTNGVSSNAYSWHGPSSGSAVHSLTQEISYLISNSKARMLANPKIVITNGKKSTIDLTQDYIESTTVQILSSNGYSDSNSVQKTFEIGEDNGIKIEVTPFISPDGYVSMDIKPDYSSVLRDVMDTYYGTPYTAATLLQRHNLELKSIRIKDEETLLLGGMITENESDTVSKIPILGDIPIIGFFFRNQAKSITKDELLIMITPRIIKDSEDVAEL